jgi:hypothetical protein
MEKIEIQNSEIAEALQLPVGRVDVRQLSSRKSSWIEAAPFTMTAADRISPPASRASFAGNLTACRSKKRPESPGCQKPQKKSDKSPKESHSWQSLLRNGRGYHRLLQIAGSLTASDFLS